jgi:PAS domain S-box-containing protein
MDGLLPAENAPAADSAQQSRQSAEAVQEERFYTLAESLPQMIFTCDGEGNKDYCCQLYLKYSGCSSFEEVGRSWVSIIHPEDRGAATAAWQKALETKTEYIAQYRMRRHDGVFRHHLARAIPTWNRAGKVTHWVGSITDIDDEKKNDELLRRTEKLAAAGRMAASLAHEINNPLASVTNALYLALQDPDLSSTTRQYLKLADRELSRVAQVTSHALRFHKQSNFPTHAELGEIMESVLTLYKGRIQASSIYLDRQYRTNERLHCGSDDLRQAFSHLLSNAVDAMPHGGRLQIRIRVARAWDGTDTSGIKVIIADSGVGIPSNFLSQVCDAFTSTKEITGTGLGLWVVNDIARKHNGHFVIRSRTDARHHGTVAVLYFPFLGLTA